MPLVELRFASYGVHILVQAPTEWLPQVTGALPPGWRGSTRATPQRVYQFSGEAPGQYTLCGDGTELARSPDLGHTLKAFESDSRLFIAEQTRTRVFLHAGVVGWRGRAILIPGRTYSGKTTLTAALVRAGATYFSDEYAVLDARGWVHPYPKPLSMRDAVTGVQTDLPVESLGGSAAKKPLPVGLVLACTYEAGAVWRPRTLTPAQGLLALADNAIAIRRSPRRVLRTLREVMVSAATVRGQRGNVEAVVDYLASEIAKVERI
jgi:hypothetical protein